jgi:hypothetical protein
VTNCTIAALAAILFEAAQLARDVAARRASKAARDLAEQPDQPSAESRHDGAT